MKYVDLNSDLGESYGSWRITGDEEIVKYVSSVNLACGLHAGDPCVMERTTVLAKEREARIGAHPGYPDLQGFGRRELGMNAEEASAFVIWQCAALEGILREHGTCLSHVKLHGALYNRAAREEAFARRICEGIARVWPGIRFYMLAGSAALKAAEEAGLTPVSEVFADRGYGPDGALVLRGRPGAMITDPEEAANRALRMVTEGTVVTAERTVIPIRADSICVHGDSPEAIETVRLLRRTLEKNGIGIRA